MTRVCFIGDSHLATLKFGLQLVARDFPNIEATFFASHGKSMRSLSLSNGALIAENELLALSLQRTSGGREAIRDEYDCYLLHGLELSIVIALLMIRARKTDPAVPPWPPEKQDDAFHGALASAIRNTNAAKILMKLRQITTAPIFLSPAPVSSVQLPALRARLVKRKESKSLVQLFETMCREIAQDRTAQFVAQPEITRDMDGIATRPDYSQSPARFSAALEGVEDKSHMNAEYGAAVLRDFLTAASRPPR